jgi:hypothetical protein
MKLPRFAPLTGIVFVVLLIIGFGVLSGDTPSSDDGAPKIISFYNDHQGREIAAGIVVVLAVLFLALFVVTLREYLKGGDGVSGFWSTVALVGGAASVAGFFGAVSVHAALIDGADQHISPAAMVALNSLDNWNFFAFVTPLAIMMFGAAGAILRGGAALPRWLGWAALVLGILYFAGPFGWFGFLLTGIWIIIASVVMYQRGGASAAPGTPAAA